MDPSPEGGLLDWSTRFGSVMPSSSASMAIPRVAHQEVFANFPYSVFGSSGGGGAANLYGASFPHMPSTSMPMAAAGQTAFDRIYREHQQAADMMHTNFAGRRRGTFPRADDIPSDHRSNRRCTDPLQSAGNDEDDVVDARIQSLLQRQQQLLSAGETDLSREVLDGTFCPSQFSSCPSYWNSDSVIGSKRKMKDQSEDKLTADIASAHTNRRRFTDPLRSEGTRADDIPSDHRSNRRYTDPLQSAGNDEDDIVEARIDGIVEARIQRLLQQRQQNLLSVGETDPSMQLLGSFYRYSNASVY